MNETISRNRIEELADEMSAFYTEVGLNSDTDELTDQVSVWAEQKSPLIALLRNHPDWDEEKLGVVITTQEQRVFDAPKAGNILYRMLGQIVRLIQDGDDPEIRATNQSRYYLLNHIHAWHLEPTVSEDTVKAVAKYEACKIKTSVGQKTSRLINRIVTDIVNTFSEETKQDFMKDYNKDFAILSDILNPIIIDRPALLSLHPMDYLNMSNGNSWSSCHDVRGRESSGCYKAGCISYMLDPSTMVFYTIGNAYVGENKWYGIPKSSRQLFHYFDGILLQNRRYPAKEDRDKVTIDNCRAAVQKVISTSDGSVNRWLKKAYDHITDYVSTDDESSHYRDYQRCGHYIPLAINKERNGGDFESDIEPIYIGHRARCIVCGHTVDDSGSLHCSNCKTHTYSECYECGCAIAEDDERWVDGYVYCSDCVNYCECCGEDHVGGQTYIDSEDRWVCQECFDEYYDRCEDCGRTGRREGDETYDVREVLTADGCTTYLCNRCIDEDYFECDECGEYINKRNHQHYEIMDSHGETKILCESCFTYFGWEQCPACNTLFDRYDMPNACPVCCLVLNESEEGNEDNIEEAV